MSEELTEEILRLTGAWYKFVGLLGHYKDRDCHWYIEVDFAYGEPPVYRVFKVRGSEGEQGATALTWYGAQEALVFAVRKAIKREQGWAKTVVEEGADEWDECQVEASEFILGVDLE